MDRLELEQKLLSIKDGEEILEYIEELEEHRCKCGEDGHHHDEDCDCGHHHDDCDCGCHDEDDEYEDITPKLVTPPLTVVQWEELLKDKSVFSEDSLIVVKRMRHVAAPMSYADLADMFGYGALYYSIEIEKLAKRLAEKLNILSIEKDDLWALIMNGWCDKSQYSDSRIFALRPELYEAIGNVDMSKVPLRMG